MKKFLTVLLVMSLALSVNPAYPKVIGDAELGQTYTFEDNAEVVLLDFSFVKEIATDSTTRDKVSKLSTARDEEFALLKAEITNLRTEGFTFGDILKVTVIYRGKITYTGAVYQYSFDKPNEVMWSSGGGYYWREEYIAPYDKPVYKWIGKMYSREFAFSCRLPKRVVNDAKSPLQMIIKIGDDELTYNIRK